MVFVDFLEVNTILYCLLNSVIGSFAEGN